MKTETRPLRLGLIVPSSNTTAEIEFSRHLPRDVSLHSARIKLIETTSEELARMSVEAESCATLLATAEVDVICYACTTGSLLKGRASELELERRIRTASGVATVTTAAAVVEALKARGIQRLTVATPYIEELNEREREYLEAAGFEVLRIQGLGIRSNLAIGRCSPSRVFELGCNVSEAEPGADGLFLSCTNLATFEILEKLSTEIGKPVISSNQASLWMSLRQLGVSGSFWGLDC
jgi:maleate isomerase